MQAKYRDYLLFIIVFVVGLLLLANIYATHRNNLVLSYSKARQAEAEQIKVRTGDIIQSLHLLDLSIRSYVFVKGDHFLLAIDTALINNQSAFRAMEEPLASQGFPMSDFYRLRDSVNSYIVVANSMLRLIEEKKEDEFVAMLKSDPGYPVWVQQREFSREVNAFENVIVRDAQASYENALRNGYFLQILLFALTMPTLGYTVYYTNRTLSMAEQLRKSEAEKSTMLRDQNLILEQTVYERTREILAQNEEISAQNEEIVSHNEQLVLQQDEIAVQRNNLEHQNLALRQAKEIIEEQSVIIQQRNMDLGEEVARQTHDLTQTNLELIEKNNRLEQFTFIISHNLRAPLARLVGLSSILDFTKDPHEVADIVKHLITTTHDLDQVVKDLTEILGIQKLSTKVMREIRLDSLFLKVKQTLETEVNETKATIRVDFSQSNVITSLHAYVESIFYNLISNAIKYRHPDRISEISVRSSIVGEFTRVDITDNGLGIDMEKHQSNIFSLYKRFHFHVEGKGLGLYLVKTQIEALGGKIEVESKVHQGTTFSLYFRNT